MIQFENFLWFFGIPVVFVFLLFFIKYNFMPTKVSHKGSRRFVFVTRLLIFSQMLKNLPKTFYPTLN